MHIGAQTQCTKTASADFCTSASATISPSAAPKIILMPAADASSGNSIRSQNTACTRGITQQIANTSKAERTVSALEEKLFFYEKKREEKILFYDSLNTYFNRFHFLYALRLHKKNF